MLKTGHFTLCLFLAIAALDFNSSKTAADEPAKKPNFIFVLSDDIAQGDMGVYGQKLIKTPRMDQIANEGTRFMQAYCGTTVCAPSRSSFFTGLHCGHCPVRGNREISPEGQFPLPDETVTIAEVAKSAGYATSTFGKWGMGFWDSTGSPSKQGVDHFFGYNCQRHAHSYFPTYLYDHEQPFLLPGNDGKGVGKTYAQEVIQNEMIRWLGKNHDKPFMMFYAMTLPHGRHEIDDYGIYEDQPWSVRQKSYAAQVTRIDSDMGELVDTLRELGIAENTLIVFSGDNGSSFNPKSEIGKLFNQAGNNLRGYKRGMYEGALRQAAFAWWPGTVPAGRVDDQPWAFWDLMPTFVEMSGATEPVGYKTDGKSLLSYFKGKDAPKRDYFYWELHESTPSQAARFENWKAVRNGLKKAIEIYDLSKDAAEQNNLADSHPEQVKKAEQIFAEAHQPDPQWPLTGKTAEQKELSKGVWAIKKERDATKWVPENAVSRPDLTSKSETESDLQTSMTESEKSAGFEALFNGTDLEGWQHNGNWKVVDGAIERQGKGGGLTFKSKKVPDDFELRFQWKVAKGSNSGIYYRPTQYEYQILDNNVHRDGKNPRTSASSLYFCMPPSEDATKPVGQWNTGRIVCKGSVIQHWLNGKKVVGFDYNDPKYKFNVDLLAARGGNLEARGAHLNLQDHGAPVWYRNLRLKPLSADDEIDTSVVVPATLPDKVKAAEEKKTKTMIERHQQREKANKEKSAK